MFACVIRLTILLACFSSAQTLLAQTLPSDSTAKKESAPKAVTDTAATPIKNQGIIISDEDILIEEGVTPIAPPKKIVADTQTSTAIQKDTSLPKAEIGTTQDSASYSARKTILRETPDSVTQNENSLSVTIDTSAQVAPKVVVAPIEASVENAQSINFARNLKEYRSPKLAMLFSFLLPGAGQAYAKNYTKTVIFGTAEIAAIVTAAIFANRGKQINLQAQNFGNEHYNPRTINKMSKYYFALQDHIRRKLITAGSGDSTFSDELADSLSWDWVNAIYYDDSLKEFNFAYEHKTSVFYHSIEGKEFVQGWDDCNPDYTVIFSKNPGDTIPSNDGRKYIVMQTSPDSSYYINRVTQGPGNAIEDSLLYGFSHNQILYKDLNSNSAFQYRIMTYVLYGLIVNHIVSAIDAGLTAKRYNDQLLRKQSFWHHIDLEQQLAVSESDVRIGCLVNFRF